MLECQQVRERVVGVVPGQGQHHALKHLLEAGIIRHRGDAGSQLVGERDELVGGHLGEYGEEVLVGGRVRLEVQPELAQAVRHLKVVLRP